MTDAHALLTASLFTAFQVAWSAGWGLLHVQIRKRRRYAEGRQRATADALYRKLNPLLFAVQLGVSTACFWSRSPWLLEFHRLTDVRIVGMVALTFAAAFYVLSIRHLGSNYAPCYDSYLPQTLTTSGPYAHIRHPMYLAKLIAGLGTLLLSGSLWFVPSTAYLFVATLRALAAEERHLSVTVTDYAAYRRRTSRLLPFLW